MKRYVERSNQIVAMQFMGWNWEAFIRLPGVIDWSMLGTLTLTTKSNHRLELESGDWLVIFSDGTLEILTTKAFCEKYEEFTETK